MLADDLAVAAYEVSKGFPREEIYGITSQIRRAASSVAANIVEGASRESAKDYAHFLQIARGSLAETQYFLHLARRLGYLGDEQAVQVEVLAKEAFACLHGLIRGCAQRDLGESIALTLKSFGLLSVGCMATRLADSAVCWPPQRPVCFRLSTRRFGSLRSAVS